MEVSHVLWLACHSWLVFIFYCGFANIKSEQTKMKAFKMVRFKTRRRSEESDNQCMLIDWFYHNPKTKDYLLFAIPNGEKRNIVTAMRLKRAGVIAGVPDLMLAVPREKKDIGVSYHGLFLEMKSAKGTLTDNQKAIQIKLMAQGYCVATCHGFDEAKTVIERYLRC